MYGLRGAFLALIFFHLRSCWHIILLNYVTTNADKIETGVTRGFVIRPFIRLMLTNELNSPMDDSKKPMFADGMIILRSGPKTGQLIAKNLTHFFIQKNRIV